MIDHGARYEDIHLIVFEGKIYSSLDFKSGYCQVEMNEASRLDTAFVI